MDAWRDSSFATPFASGRSHRRTGEHGEKALMTLWRNLVVALVAAFALAACSSSNNGTDTSTMSTETPTMAEPSGPTQEELDAEKMRADEAEQALRDKEAEEAEEALSETAANLKGALRTDPLGDYDVAPLATAALTPGGLVLAINDDRDDGTTAAVNTPRMASDGSAGALGDWAGTNYAHTNAGGVTNSAVVYTNQAAVKAYPIVNRYVVTANVPTNAGTYTAAMRTLSLGTAADPNIKSDMFPTAGLSTYTPTAPASEVLIPGTYEGAVGNYRCGAGETCTAQASAAGIALSDAFMFIHDEGATVEVAVVDPNYLYFGWWLRTDDDDQPTMASAFTGVQGAIAALGRNPNALGGSATYSGHAAGKFAVSDPLGADNAGHFTADATLTAVFAADAVGGGVSGTLDNFMANDEAMPWSVTLLRRGWDGTTLGLANVGINDPATAEIDEAATSTVWSIDDNASAPSGSWMAQMYDEAPGTVAAGGDGSDVPTSATGVFQSHFGGVGTMVGAFGVTRD